MYELLYWQTISIIPEIYYTISIMILILVGAFNIENINSNKELNLSKLDIKIFGYLSLQIILINILLLNTININTMINTLFKLDNLSIITSNLILLIAIFYILSIINLLKQDLRYTYEYLILILTSILGMLLLIKANDLIAMYLAMELQSMGMYVLSTYSRTSLFGTEGGLKYYIMGSISSCFQLLGIAIIYGLTGVTNYLDLSILIGDNLIDNTHLILAYILILIGLLFKLGAAPFHMWAPDVYQGAPLGSTTFFSIIPKLALIIGLYRLLNINDINSININNFLIFISIFSILIGTIQAIGQTNIKRLLSYSSISHVGFIIIGILTGYNTLIGIKTSLFYILIYMIMSIIIFTLLIELKITNPNKNNYYELLELKNLSRIQPLMALSFSIVLFSMAGIPPLAGFYSKYYILIDAINGNYLILSLIAILGSAIAAYYYINMIQLFYFYTENLNKRNININYISKLNSYIISIFIIILCMIFNLEVDILYYFTQVL